MAASTITVRPSALEIAHSAAAAIPSKYRRVLFSVSWESSLAPDSLP